MTDPLAKWHQEHANFARLLDLLERELARFHTGALPDYELMLDVMYYMTHYPDRFHHPVEDAAFDRIVARDAATAPTLARLREQHDWLRSEGEALVEILDDVVNGAIRTRASIEQRAEEYIARFRRHMTIEDTTVFPAASQVLTPADWEQVTAAAVAEDPLFGGAVAARYAALDEAITREAAAGRG